ncbi:transposable element Tcb1 transposase [Trichonephila clavipes]|nr:transposable element Tcb1 transposase [Trichonephila clavipes]
MPGKRARRHFSQLSEFERGLIIGMKTAGWSTCRVAARWIVRSVPLEIVGSSGHEKVPTRGKPGSGASRKTTRRDDQRIVRQALVDPTVTRSTIRADVGVAIVPQTISRHLAEANLKSKRPFRALPLTPEHRQLRPQWCQARSTWNVTDWQKVVFSDESRFVLGTDDKRVRTWRRPGERYNSPHTVLRHTARTASVMQDNASPHTARVAQDFLRYFQTFPWPARTPDLSPVEHVWDQLKRQMPSCHSVHDLELAVQDLWAHLPQDNIRCLINSMPDRVAASTLQYSQVQISKLTPIIQSKPLMRSPAPATPLVPATDFHAHHHQPRSKIKPIQKQGRAEVPMPLRRFRRQYEQLSHFEKGRIIGMMEAGWSARRVAYQLGRSDCIPTASSAAIQAQVIPSLGPPVSSRTIRRRVAKGHLRSRRPLRVLPSTLPFGVVPRTRKLSCSGMKPGRF